MWRVSLVLIVALSTALLARAELSSADTALAQIQDCLELRLEPGVEKTVNGRGSALTFQSLATTLGIGVLSMLFLVPVALLSEWLSGRSKPGSGTRAAWE